jgi:hypothetical protein
VRSFPGRYRRTFSCRMPPDEVPRTFEGSIHPTSQKVDPANHSALTAYWEVALASHTLTIVTGQ